jgi:methionine-rich copper-binding protein CopC
MRKKLRATLALIFATLALFSIQTLPASAHSDLVSSDPEASSVLAEMPTSVLLTFNEELLILDGAEDANQLIVTDSEGSPLVEGELTVAANTISSALAASEAQGEVTVTYRVVSADGHPIEGSFSFVVGEESSNVIAPAPAGELEHAAQKQDWTLIFLSIVGLATAGALAFIYRRKSSTNQN